MLPKPALQTHSSSDSALHVLYRGVLRSDVALGHKGKSSQAEVCLWHDLETHAVQLHAVQAGHRSHSLVVPGSMLNCRQGSPHEVGDHVVHAPEASLAQAHHVGQVGRLCTGPHPLKTFDLMMCSPVLS